MKLICLGLGLSTISLAAVEGSDFHPHFCKGALQFVARTLYAPSKEKLLRPPIISRDGQFFGIQIGSEIRVYSTRSGEVRGRIPKTRNLIARSIDFGSFLVVKDADPDSNENSVFDLDSGKLHFSSKFEAKRTSGSMLEQMLIGSRKFGAIGASHLFGSWSEKGLFIYDAADSDPETREIPFQVIGNFSRFDRITIFPEKNFAVFVPPNNGIGGGAIPEVVEIKNWNIGTRTLIQENYPLSPPEYIGSHREMDELKRQIENNVEPRTDLDLDSLFRRSLVGQYVRETEISRDGSLMFTHSVRGLNEDRHCLIDFFSLPTGEFLQRFTIRSPEVLEMTLSPDNRWLAVLSAVPPSSDSKDNVDRLEIFDRRSAQPEKSVLAFDISVPFEYPFVWHKRIQFRDANAFIATFGDKRILEITLQPR